MPEVRIDNIHPVIKAFIGNVTEKQWALLTVGTPDDTTQVLLAEMFMNIVTALREAFLQAFRSMDVVVSEDCVRATLGDTIPESFAEVLKVDDQVQCASSKLLSDMVIREVTDSVNSALSTSNSSAETVIYQRMTPPSRLNAMIGHACKMLKVLATKMKHYSPHKPPRVSNSTQESAPESEKEGDLESSVIEENSPSPVSVSPEDTATALIEHIGEIISKEAGDIVIPLLDMDEFEQMSSCSTYGGYQTRITEEFFKFTGKKEWCVERLWRNTKTFLVKCFAKAWMLRLVSQVKAVFHLGSNVKGTEVLLAILEDFLPGEDHEGLEFGNAEMGVVQKFRDISRANVVINTQELTDLLYSHCAVGLEVIPEQIRGSESNQTVQSHAGLYADIQTRVWGFLGVMSWWLNNQVGSHSDRMNMAIMATEPLALVPEVIEVPDSVCEETIDEPTQDATLYNENINIVVLSVVQKLVSRIFEKTKVNGNFSNPEEIIDRLYQSTLAKVDGQDITITGTNLKNLHKVVVRDLCETWGSADMVLASMKLGDRELDEMISTTVKTHLVTPLKERSRICRFFSSVGRAISNICKCRHDG
ncbi:hypothetical protein CgunFtcFv8_026101 [Champsocephalus gunnari]|uniref:Uncharacterized protein n=1 Tax=Champsocephalus gunnari TaxID=52237 RepID=A0AAN8H3I0_CHAGU|nr:hypothetical protein CgunFtcFv8_026101 [Champsocephalus gunnari]